MLSERELHERSDPERRPSEGGISERRIDRRTLRGEKDPEGIALLRARSRALGDAEIAYAKLMVRLHEQGSCVWESAASTWELSERYGFDGARGRQLLMLGYALERLPGLEEEVRAGGISFAAAILLGDVFVDPERYLEAGDDWLDLARSLRVGALRRRVGRRLAARRHVAPESDVTTFVAHVGPDAADDLRACRRIAKKKAECAIDNGQLLAVLAYAYRARWDPTRKEPRPRRLPPTEERPGDREVPAEVVRAIRRRSGGLCEVGLCTRVAAELCHVRPHADGSGREAKDLFDGCVVHHKNYDLGMIALRCWSTDGRPLFVIAATGAFLAPKPLPEDREPPERPAWLLRAVGKTPRRRRREPAGGRERGKPAAGRERREPAAGRAQRAGQAGQAGRPRAPP